jgi:hypothetical protein
MYLCCSFSIKIKDFCCFFCDLINIEYFCHELFDFWFLLLRTEKWQVYQSLAWYLYFWIGIFFPCKISFLHNFIFEIEMLFFPPTDYIIIIFQLFWMSDKFCLLFVRITAIKNLLIFAILIFLMIEMESDYLLNHLIWEGFFCEILDRIVDRVFCRFDFVVFFNWKPINFHFIPHHREFLESNY